VALSSHSSSSFTEPAVETADDLQICLVDRTILSRGMLKRQIASKIGNTYEIDEESFQAFEKPTKDDLVLSKEVPPSPQRYRVNGDSDLLDLLHQVNGKVNQRLSD
jgi:hypothetical protein